MAKPTPSKTVRPSQTPARPTSPPAVVTRPRYLQWTALAVLVIFGMSGGYFAYQNSRSQPATNTTTNTNSVTDENSNTDVVEVNSNTNVPPGTSVGTVAWTSAKAIPSVDLYTIPAGDPAMVFNPNTSAKMVEVGTVTSGAFKGGTVIRYSYQEEGPVFYPVYSYLIRQNGKYTLLMKNSGQLAAYDGGPQLDESLVTQDDEHELHDLRFPDTLNGPKPRQILKLQLGVNAEFTTTGLTKVFTDAAYGAVYTKVSTFGTTTLNTNADSYLSNTAFSTRNGFYLKAPDGTVRVYTLDVDIIDNTDGRYTYSGVPNVTWEDGTVNTTKYNLTAFGGCGAINYINVIDSALVDPAKDLVQVGSTAQGDAIYELKDSQSKLLKDFYSSTVYNPDETYNGSATQRPYNEFIADHPLIFWIDPFGRLIELTSGKYGTLAECGKPVIYLYPPKTTTVSVQLEPRGGFTKTEPAYGRGWNVLAQPNGLLTNLADGRTYPYLFWEGRGGLYIEPTAGFTVAQDDVHSFLIEKLHRLGLNEQESKDFIEFWEPRMQGSPYYIVSFLGKRSMDELAPLTVTPQPDTVIRVLMDFKPVNQAVVIPAQHIITPVRSGFTVVEWGGVLR